EPELIRAAITHVGIKGVIIAEGADEILGVDRAAEEFKAIVGDGVGFDILNRRATTNRAERQTIDFLVGGKFRAAVADRDIADDTRVVVVIVAAVAEGEFATEINVGETFIDFILWGG